MLSLILLISLIRDLIKTVYVTNLVSTPKPCVLLSSISTQNNWGEYIPTLLRVVVCYQGMPTYIKHSASFFLWKVTYLPRILIVEDFFLYFIHISISLGKISWKSKSKVLLFWGFFNLTAKAKKIPFTSECVPRMLWGVAPFCQPYIWLSRN